MAEETVTLQLIASQPHSCQGGEVDLKLAPFSEVARSAAGPLAILGTPSALERAASEGRFTRPICELMTGILGGVQVGDRGTLTCSWLPDGSETRPVWIGLVPTQASRHNSPSRPDAIEDFVERVLDAQEDLRRPEALDILVPTITSEGVLVSTLAAARAIPAYDQKASRRLERVRLGAVALDRGQEKLPRIDRLRTVVDAVRNAAAWHDTPAEHWNIEQCLSTARILAQDVGARCTVIRGKELEERGFGGLHAVGRAAEQPPALVVLDYEPKESSSKAEKQVWVGKGIVFDGGGLSLKSLTEMQGMKGDMAGAAAVLAAFGAAVRLGPPGPLSAVLCVAENAIGPRSFRVDDVIRLYSGKSVEIRNTDAEGRLALADGVAHAVRDLKAKLVVDLGTLTDAAVTAVGNRHAAIVTNDGALQSTAIQVGRTMGELVHPLPHLPELLRSELHSEVADLSNVGRSAHNANASVAAQFIFENLGQFSGKWLHVDLEGPSRSKKGRGTGFGVGLLLGVLGIQV